MHNNGLEEVRLSSGVTAQVKTKTYASVNRAKIDQVAEWLEKNDGGHLVKKDCTVADNYTQLLETMQIPFKKNMNYDGYTLTIYRGNTVKKSGNIGTAMTAVG